MARDKLFEELFNPFLQEKLKGSVEDVKATYDQLRPYFKSSSNEIEGALIEIAPLIKNAEQFIETYELLRKQFHSYLSVHETAGLIKSTANYIIVKSLETMVELLPSSTKEE